MRVLGILVLSLLIAGCATYARLLPKDYKGAVASIDDSFQRQSLSNANFFYIKLIDGKPIYHALVASSQASAGKGSRLITMGESRNVPVRPVKLYIVGQVHHAAIIGSILNSETNYIVEGEFEFTPEKDAKYLVNGSLSKDYSAVWIEDVNGNVVSNIIEKSSSSYVPKARMKDRSEKKKPSRKELFHNLTGGESERLVVSKIGNPDKVFKNEGNFFSGRAPNVTYEYDSLGKIQFSARDDIPLFIDKVIPIVKWSGNISSIKTQLKSSGEALQRYAKSYYQQSELQTDILDLIAAKIWEAKDTQSPYNVDAISWLCKVLGKSHNSRYRTLLENVARMANSNKLRKYAKSSLDLLPETKVEQFSVVNK
ncbi:hypothetical protein [Aliikangiella sp. G2MR2-5]|uniref:hypothetical protein n=1 Tax=Aliikangiella sp. G2MR2-5 TaxID=2788943 RepID=UPI0018A93407|nr:hypothetical protein [Aliikangiella sp. G2MR2-5]